MLSLQTVLPDTLELLKVLMQQPLFSDMRLVGGTALALQYGHRSDGARNKERLCRYPLVTSEKSLLG